jgi:hypothetical protein
MWKFTIGRFTIRAEIMPDDDLDLSWDETGETRANLESGFWEAFITKVSVELNGAEIAADWLGGSIYENPSDFFTEHYGLAHFNRLTGAHCGAYFPDMVRAAISGARQWMRDAGMAAAA